jgi:hypothetical protein
MRSRAWRSLDLLLALSIFGAAMFTEPAVTEIEEMIGLIHGKKGVGGWVLGVGRVLQHPTPNTQHPTPNTLHPFSYRRRVSGVSVRRTGTEVRRPLRTICT